MKKCTYCGKEYPDEATTCAIDDNPLEMIVATPIVAVKHPAPVALAVIRFGWPVVRCQTDGVAQLSFVRRLL